jgi:hypothetical protein
MTIPIIIAIQPTMNSTIPAIEKAAELLIIFDDPHFIQILRCPLEYRIN